MVDNRQKYFVRLFNIFTILVWGWFALQFLGRGAPDVPRSLGDLYLLVLGYYAGDKEIRRWRRQHESVRRRGELFVIGWAATIFFMLIIEIFGGAEQGYRVPEDMAFVVGGVFIIYVVTQYLKSEFRRKAR